MIRGRFARNKVSPDQVVVITGCGRGFGRALAVRCVSMGFKTYAVCRTEKGTEGLKAEVRRISGNIHIVCACRHRVTSIIMH